MMRSPFPFRPIDPLDTAVTQDGMSLRALSRLSPTVLVCLPALGRPLTRRMLADFSQRRRALEEHGRRTALLHMGRDEEAIRELSRFDLQYVARVADPQRTVYAALGLGSLRRPAPGSWIPALLARLRHGSGTRAGDPRQAHGAFLMAAGAVEREAKCACPADLPDYATLTGSPSG
ncbi:MAG: hypothetical protein ACT4PV_10030 [Planctomycetaceae bacterium]